jgi:hypothetical protein
LRRIAALRGISPTAGTFTVILISQSEGAFVSVTVLLILYQAEIQSLIGIFPTWFFPCVIGLDVARLILLTGLWQGHKWAIFPLFLCMGLEVFIGVFLVQTVFTFSARLTLALGGWAVIGGLFAYALRQRWEYFVAHKV